MYRAFNLKGIGLEFFPETECWRWYRRGEELIKENRESVQPTLEKLATDIRILDAKVIQEEWFELIKADVFLSHSHQDLALVELLAGWLNVNFGLKCFVDSSIWGYADDLLKMIDDKYCSMGDGFKYDYQKRNRSTSHVYMILMTALQQMIYKTECLIFVNTPKSVAGQNIIETKTYSPWIYGELVMAGMVHITIPDRDGEGNVYKEAREHMGPKVLYTVPDMSRLMEMRTGTLNTWRNEWRNEWRNRWFLPRGSSIGALDLLYRIVDSGQRE